VYERAQAEVADDQPSAYAAPTVPGVINCVAALSQIGPTHLRLQFPLSRLEASCETQRH
jgi:hypothetical protein